MCHVLFMSSQDIPEDCKSSVSSVRCKEDKELFILKVYNTKTSKSQIMPWQMYVSSFVVHSFWFVCQKKTTLLPSCCCSLSFTKTVYKLNSLPTDSFTWKQCECKFQSCFSWCKSLNLQVITCHAPPYKLTTDATYMMSKW